MQFVKSDLGLEIKTENYHVFFGNKKASIELLKSEFSKYEYLRIKQIHSATVVEGSLEVQVADAHYTDKKNCALVIATADCVPILIYDKKTSLVASVHAGWKGVATQILPATIGDLIKKGATIENCDFFIGPHILQGSFEIELDVKSQLNESITEFKKFYYSKQINGVDKFYVNLQALLCEQIFKLGGNIAQIYNAEIDTKVNLDWHSFRRDKANSGRNISFICSLNTCGK